MVGLFSRSGHGNRTEKNGRWADSAAEARNWLRRIPPYGLPVSRCFAPSQKLILYHCQAVCPVNNCHTRHSLAWVTRHRSLRNSATLDLLTSRSRVYWSSGSVSTCMQPNTTFILISPQVTFSTSWRSHKRCPLFRQKMAVGIQANELQLVFTAIDKQLGTDSHRWKGSSSPTF